MTPFAPTPLLLETASHVVWFQEPEATLQDPIRFVAYAMRYGTAEDIVALENAGIGEEEYRDVLDSAPAGLFDQRSWTYWHLRCGRRVIPPLPTRRISIP
jgi:hypothetical protein